MLERERERKREREREREREKESFRAIDKQLDWEKHIHTKCKHLGLSKIY